ncbi:MAG: hypothetical protein HY735_31490 [Verrucomicrobia bacterium]|nr:hypothetical protein [Verrucomicrobiota bacterium]
MTPYFDLGFLLTLVVKSPGRGTAWQAASRFNPPYRLNFLHQFHLENGLARQLLSPKSEAREIGAQALRQWNQYLDEGVFVVTSGEWDTAFRLAIGWNRNFTRTVPLPTFILHPALALAEAATHFLSFQPENRQVARATGLRLLPERL